MGLSKRQIWLLKQVSILFVRGSVTRISELVQEAMWFFRKLTDGDKKMGKASRASLTSQVTSWNVVSFQEDSC
jgi:hypothetical protein